MQRFGRILPVALVGVSDGRFDASSIAAAGEAMLKFNSILPG